MANTALCHLLLTLALLLIDNHKFPNKIKNIFFLWAYASARPCGGTPCAAPWRTPCPGLTLMQCSRMPWRELGVEDGRGGRRVIGPPRTCVCGRGHIIFLVSHTDSQPGYILKSSVPFKCQEIRSRDFFQLAR
jgi:hypothetical protein